MVVFIVMRDLLTWPRAMCQYLEQIPAVDLILVDNASTYPPLLEWYEGCPYDVRWLPENLGHLSPWLSGIVDREAGNWYCVSDPDLDLSGVPLNFLDRLQEGMLRYLNVPKCGLSLETSDLTDQHPLKARVEEASSRLFWIEKTWCGRFWRANIDTTFALHKRDRQIDPTVPRAALVADRPYTARHLSWYLDPATFTDEYRYYLAHADPRWVSTWPIG